MSSHPVILACRYGGWSHINESFFKALRHEYPQHEWREFDYHKEVIQAHWGWRLRWLLEAGVVYRRRLARLLPKPGLLRYEWRDAALLTTQSFKAGHRLAQAKLRKLLNGQPATLVIQTGSRYSARLPECPHFIYTDHTHLTNLQYPAFDRSQLNCQGWIDCEREMYRSASGLLTMSDNVRRSALQDYGVPAEKCITVGAGFNASPDASEKSADRDWTRKEILFVGTEWDRKGGPWLLRSFQELRKIHPDATLTVVGCHPKIHEANVDVVGFVPLQQVRSYMERATVFCLPTRQEPFGIVFLEAMAFGMPVVASQNGALPEIVGHGSTGLLVPDNDVGALTAALKSLLDSPQLSATMGAAGRERAYGYHQWRQVADRTKQALDALSHHTATPI